MTKKALPTPLYTFRNLKYRETRRGVHVRGDVYESGRKVGTFAQEPCAACIVRGPQISCDEAEKLLSAAETLLLAEQ